MKSHRRNKLFKADSAYVPIATMRDRLWKGYLCVAKWYVWEFKKATFRLWIDWYYRGV